MVNLLYKSAWILWIIILIFLREFSLGKSIILFMAIFLSIIAVKRAINARNDWRSIAKEYHRGLDD